MMKGKKMKNIQYGVVLENSASSLTQGRPGPGSEGYYQTRFQDKKAAKQTLSINYLMSVCLNLN